MVRVDELKYLLWTTLEENILLMYGASLEDF